MDNKVELFKSFPCGFESSFKTGLYDFMYLRRVYYHKKVLQTLSIGF